MLTVSSVSAGTTYYAKAGDDGPIWNLWKVISRVAQGAEIMV
jgi:hypothetical protein